MIMFVGLAPSSKNEDPRVPFKGTKSGERLKRWINTCGVRSYALYNLFLEVLPRGPLLKEELQRAGSKLRDKAQYADGVVALGQEASRALKLAGIGHYRMPHPSGRNRLFNNKAYEPMVVAKLKTWVENLNETL